MNKIDKRIDALLERGYSETQIVKLVLKEERRDEIEALAQEILEFVVGEAEEGEQSGRMHRFTFDGFTFGAFSDYRYDEPDSAMCGWIALQTGDGDWDPDAFSEWEDMGMSPTWTFCGKQGIVGALEFIAENGVEVYYE